MTKYSAIGLLCAALAVGACGSKGESKGHPAPDKAVQPAAAAQQPAKAAKPAASGPVLLAAMSTFAQDAAGKYVRPDKAKLLLLHPSTSGAWKTDAIEDGDSNVFHKALALEKDAILTLGGNKAMLKLWRKKGDDWTATTLWNPEFGGKNNRLRDAELADIDGDGQRDLAVATHDQGVVAVVWHRGDTWTPQELDRRPDTFVHEIEIGDLDRDGKVEIYATPSDPNTASGVGQGGAIVGYRYEGGTRFTKFEVARFDKRHVKEILVADVDGDGSQELYAALEAQMGPGGKVEVPVEIARFDRTDKGFVKTVVTTISDRFCRFLTAADLDGDKKVELIISAFSAGVYVARHSASGWNATVVDAATGGFEHAAFAADMDGNGVPELYVANDNAGTIDRYVMGRTGYLKTSVYKRLVPRAAMVWNFDVLR